MHQLTVSDLMTKDVLSVHPEDTLSVAREKMDDADSRHVPVIDEDDRVVGLVSHRDLLRAAMIDRDELTVNVQQEVLAEHRVRDVMSYPVATIEADAPIIEAAGIMLENKFDCLPVVDEDRLAGILTASDFVRWVAEHDHD